MEKEGSRKKEERDADIFFCRGEEEFQNTLSVRNCAQYLYYLGPINKISCFTSVHSQNAH